MNDTIEIVAGLVRNAQHMLFITGAGLSADSGLPTYRGIGGLYDGRTTDEGVPIEEALSGPMLQRDPALTWKYLWQIGAACRSASFNRGHEVIAEIEQMQEDTWILTQNVDGFHRAAGSKNLIEIHGRASDLYCLQCSKRFDANDLIDGYAGDVELPPRCPSCNGLIRPDVVLFEEMLPANALHTMYDMLPSRDLVFAIGTSAAFPYIIEPVAAARRAGIPTVEINPSRTEVSELFDHQLACGAAEALSELWDVVRGE